MARPKDNYSRTTLERQRDFLAAYAECGNIRVAAERANIDRKTHNYWLAHDPNYAAAFEESKEQAADLLEQEAWRRAVEGVKEPVYQKGQLVGEVTKYSDTLLMFLLKGVRPEKFRENIRQEVTGPDGQPFEVNIRVIE